MKIQVIRGVVIGGTGYEPGEVIDVADEVGIRLVNMGKVRAYEAATEATEDRAVGLTTKSAGALLKRGAKKKAK
jgi:arginase family enzyme